MKDSGVSKQNMPEEVTSEERSGSKVLDVISVLGKVIYRLRKVFLSIPVIYYAFRLAVYNLENLPEQVGFNLQSNGEFAQMVTREAAVMGPLAVTAACLVLMFLSRKSVYPWVISIFSLVLPILILVTNNYPA